MITATAWSRRGVQPDLQQLASFSLGGAPLAQVAASQLGAPGALQAHHPAAVQQEGLAGLPPPPVALDAQCRPLLPAHIMPLLLHVWEYSLCRNHIMQLLPQLSLVMEYSSGYTHHACDGILLMTPESLLQTHE